MRRDSISPARIISCQVRGGSSRANHYASRLRDYQSQCMHQINARQAAGLLGNLGAPFSSSQHCTSLAEHEHFPHFFWGKTNSRERLITASNYYFLSIEFSRSCYPPHTIVSLLICKHWWENCFLKSQLLIFTNWGVKVYEWKSAMQS